jgi:hypothetical protein
MFYSKDILTKLDNSLGESSICDFSTIEEIKKYFSMENYNWMWPGHSVPNNEILQLREAAIDQWKVAIVQKRIQEISKTREGIAYDDFGNGSAGPGIIDDIDDLEDDYFDGFERDETPQTNIRETFKTLGIEAGETNWWTATKIIGEGDSPYTVHLILWDE